MLNLSYFWVNSLEGSEENLLDFYLFDKIPFMKCVTSSIIKLCALCLGRLPGKSTIWGTYEVVVPLLAFSLLTMFIIKVVHSGGSSLGVWPGQTRLPCPHFWATFFPGRARVYRNSNYCPEMTAYRRLWQPADLTSGRPAACSLAAQCTSLFFRNSGWKDGGRASTQGGPLAT